MKLRDDLDLEESGTDFKFRDWKTKDLKNDPKNTATRSNTLDKLQNYN